jgi:hypothetical protein
LARELGLAEVHLQAFHAYLPWHASMRLRPEDQPLLLREIEAAERELSTSTIPLHVQFALDQPSEHAGDAPDAPDHRSILREIDRTPPPVTKHSEPWEVMARRLHDAAGLRVPGEIRACLSESGEVPSDGQRRRRRPSPAATAPRADRNRPCAFPIASPRMRSVPAEDGAIGPCCIIEHRAGDLSSAAVGPLARPAYPVRRALRDASTFRATSWAAATVPLRDAAPVLGLSPSMGIDLEKSSCRTTARCRRPPWISKRLRRKPCDGSLAGTSTMCGRTVVAWAFHRSPCRVENVDVWVDGTFLVRSAASHFRDLASAGIGDSRHGLAVGCLPNCAMVGTRIRTRFARGGADLVGSLEGSSSPAEPCGCSGSP